MGELALPIHTAAARLWSAALAAWGALIGLLPHVLHHAGPLAGAEIVAGAGGTVLFGANERLREISDRALWLEDGRLRTLEALVRDPVCGMLLDPAQAQARLEHDGETVYFCSRGCREEYEEGLEAA